MQELRKLIRENRLEGNDRADAKDAVAYLRYLHAFHPEGWERKEEIQMMFVTEIVEAYQ